MDQIEKYFILVVFALYCKETGPAGFSPSWSSWFASSPYPDQIATGKSKLEWEGKFLGNRSQHSRNSWMWTTSMKTFQRSLTRLISWLIRSSMIYHEEIRSVSL